MDRIEELYDAGHSDALAGRSKRNTGRGHWERVAYDRGFKAGCSSREFRRDVAHAKALASFILDD